jgi:hypothetical protein
VNVSRQDSPTKTFYAFLISPILSIHLYTPPFQNPTINTLPIQSWSSSLRDITISRLLQSCFIQIYVWALCFHATSTHHRTFSARPRVGMCRQCPRPRATNVRHSVRVRAMMRLMSVFLFRIKGRSCPNTSEHERPDYTSRAAQSCNTESSTPRQQLVHLPSAPPLTRMTIERCDHRVRTGTLAHEWFGESFVVESRRVHSAICGSNITHV